MAGFLSGARTTAWALAVAANLLALWLGWTAVSGTMSAASDASSAGAAGAAIGGMVGLGYALTLAIVPTCLARSIDGMTRG